MTTSKTTNPQWSIQRNKIGLICISPSTIQPQQKCTLVSINRWWEMNLTPITPTAHQPHGLNYPMTARLRLTKRCGISIKTNGITDSRWNSKPKIRNRTTGFQHSNIRGKISDKGEKYKNNRWTKFRWDRNALSIQRSARGRGRHKNPQHGFLKENRILCKRRSNGGKNSWGSKIKSKGEKARQNSWTEKVKLS